MCDDDLDFVVVPPAVKAANDRYIRSLRAPAEDRETTTPEAAAAFERDREERPSARVGGLRSDVDDLPSRDEL